MVISALRVFRICLLLSFQGGFNDFVFLRSVFNDSQMSSNIKDPDVDRVVFFCFSFFIAYFHQCFPC